MNSLKGIRFNSSRFGSRGQPFHKARVRTMRIQLLAIVFWVIALAGIAQPSRRAEASMPEQAYQQLLSVSSFAFGGVGYAGVTSEGEAAYRVIARSTNAVALFSGVFTNGNAQAKLYALCGIRQLAPANFHSYADSLRSGNQEVETIHGCIIHHDFTTNVISQISSGFYDLWLTNASRPVPTRR